MLPRAFYLAGDVGVAAHLSHRTSRDLDLFAPSDPTELLTALQTVPGVGITSQAPATLYLVVDGVEVSLIEYRYPSLSPPERVADLPVDVASLEDLACMKLSAIAGRGAARDFWDLHAIVTATGRPLPDWLATFQRKHPAVDVGHVVRSLVYFGDAEAQPLPRGLTAERWRAIRAYLERWVEALVAP